MPRPEPDRASAQSKRPSPDPSREIADLHRFFEDWFAARLPADDAALARLVDSLAEGFVLVSPRGTRLDRAALVESLRAAHGSRAGDPEFRIWVEEIASRPLGGGLHLVTYEEWQTMRDERSVRLSSALLREHPAAPDGLLWEHVHETWRP